jgi:predicted AlkP superfamily phosphohydrolase/phosphomutase
MSKMKNSVLLIGIDGASWNLLNPWMNQGYLPNLKKMVKDGASGNLKSTIPLESGSTWTSLTTGKNPAKHAIFSFVGEDGRLIDSSAVKSERIWHILAKHNKRCGIINIPVTYPVEEINGYMISSFLTPPNKVYYHPPKLKQILIKYKYKIDIILKQQKYPFLQDQMKNNKEEKKKFYFNELHRILKSRYLTLKKLMNEKWDFFMVNFKECDGFQHIFWDDKNAMLDFFRKVDLYVGDLVDTFSKKNRHPYIFIVSDHGFGHSPTRSFNIFQWLIKEGMLSDERNFKQKAVIKTYHLLKKVPGVHILFKLKTLQGAREMFKTKSIKTFPFSYRQFGIFIDKSRIKGPYEGVRGSLIRKLKNIKDNNKRVFKIVEKKEKIYSGDYIAKAPDIVLLTEPGYDAIFSESNKIFDNIKPLVSGKHISELYGIHVITGDGIQQSTINASILDICPTILYLLGVPIPRDIDGKVLKEIFKKDSDAYNLKIKFQEGDVHKSEIEKIRRSIGKIKI